MQQGTFSDYLVSQWLKDFSTCWVALHYDNPDTAGAYASEIFGGSYVRAKASFSDPTNRVTWNVTDIHFAGLPAAVVTHLGLWDTQINGNYLASVEFPIPRRIIAGGRIDIGTNQIAVSAKSL